MKVIRAIIIVCLLMYIIPFLLVFINKDKHVKDKVDYIIVLGAKVNGLSPSKALQYRLDEAYKLKQVNPEAYLVLSGAQGADEDYTEAYVMQAYLLEKGVKKEDMIIEDKSYNTFENLTNSKELIDQSKNVAVVTNNFHIYRSSVLCKRVFKKQCYMQSAPSYSGWLGISSFLREPIALYKSFLLDR